MFFSDSLNSIKRHWLSFIKRIFLLKSLTGSVIPAINIIAGFIRNRNAVQSINYHGVIINFRRSDEDALSEVLARKEYGFLKKFLLCQKSPKILDVGAHIGTFAIWVFGVNKFAQVLSVEADPQTYKIANENRSFYITKGVKWDVVHAAGGREKGSLLLLQNNEQSMSNRIDKFGSIEVPSIDLKSLLNIISPNNGTVDLVKIDIEGSEEAFLLSSSEALHRVGSLVIELHPNLCDIKSVKSLLNNCFDHIENVCGRKSMKPILFCRRNTDLDFPQNSRHG